MEFKELGKHRVFLGFFNTYGFEMYTSLMNNFYKYRNKQAYLWIFTNVFKSFSFQKISDFLVVFQTIQTFDFKHYLWTHQHFICWRFSKYLYSQGTSESREIILSDGCSLFLNEPNNINFWKCNISNNVWHVNTTGCIMLMNGDECCFVSYIFNVVVFNWGTTAPGRFRRLVRGCDRLVSELCL